MTDRERVLIALREAGPSGLHSTAMRRTGLTGNPSQRIAELREMGYEIEAKGQPWKDGNGKQRHGALYILRSGPGLGAGKAAADPPTPPVNLAAAGGPASVEPETGALFELPSYMDPDAYDSEAA